MDWRVPFCSLLFAIINLLMVSTGAARLAGVYTKRIATALTLFNTFILISRMANLLMVPEIGKLADLARSSGNIGLLETEFRIILGAAAVGCAVATLLIPTFVQVFNRGILSFEKTNSLPRIFLRLVDPRRSWLHAGVLVMLAGFGGWAGWWFAQRSLILGWGGQGAVPVMAGVFSGFSFYIVGACLFRILQRDIYRAPSWMGVSFSSLSKIPKDFLLLNVFVQAFWTVGWMAAVYAGAADSRLAITSVSLSGIVTGVSTILLTVFVDPKAALITDQSAHGIRTEEEIKAVVIFLTLGSVFGTLFAQALFNPAAYLIRLVALHI